MFLVSDIYIYIDIYRYISIYIYIYIHTNCMNVYTHTQM